MRTLIVAEVGSVHDGSLGNALHLIDAAAACGTDAVKFQTHLADAETLPDAPMPPFFTGEPWSNVPVDTSLRRRGRCARSCGDSRTQDRLRQGHVSRGLRAQSSPASADSLSSGMNWT